MGLYALGVPLGFLVLPVGDGWLEGGVTGRVAGVGVGEQLGPSFLPGPVFGQVHRDAAAGGGDFRGDVNELVADGQGNGFPGSTAGEGAGIAGQVERDACEHEPRCVGAENTGWEVWQRLRFYVGIQILDDRMLAVGFVGIKVLSEAPPVFCRSYAGGSSRLRVA